LLVVLLLGFVFAFLLVLVPYVICEGLVEFAYPLLDAAKMEGLAALLAVPQSRPLVDEVLAYNALLGAGSELLYEESALFGQVFELTEEVFEVVLDLGLVAFVFALLLVVLNFFLGLGMLFIKVLDIGRSRADFRLALELAAALASLLDPIGLVLQYLLKLPFSVLVDKLLSIPCLVCFFLFSCVKEILFASTLLLLRFSLLNRVRSTSRCLVDRLFHLDLFWSLLFLFFISWVLGGLGLLRLIAGSLVSATSCRHSPSASVAGKWLLHLLEMLLKRRLLIVWSMLLSCLVPFISSVFSWLSTAIAPILTFALVGLLRLLFSSHRLEKLLVYF
jgi:hypothetical protein